jgi:drug/metabolite transporter (DMT)-like permease
MKWAVSSGKTEHVRCVILLVITAVLWSSGGLLIKAIDWHPLAIAGMRSAIAALVIWLAFRNEKINYSAPQLMGAAAYAGTVILFVSATKLTTAANAILIQYSAPVFVALLATWFLNEKPRSADWLTIGVVFGGLLLFFQDKMSTGGLLGNLLALASGFTMAVMIVSMRKQKDGSPFGSVLLGNGATVLFGLPFMLGSGPDLTGWIALGFLGVFQLGLSYVLYSVAIKHVTALEAIIITTIEPILNPVWVFLFLGEQPGPWSLVGGLVILIAILARYILPSLKGPADAPPAL